MSMQLSSHDISVYCRSCIDPCSTLHALQLHSSFLLHCVVAQLLPHSSLPRGIIRPEIFTLGQPQICGPKNTHTMPGLKFYFSIAWMATISNTWLISNLYTDRMEPHKANLRSCFTGSRMGYDKSSTNSSTNVTE